MPDSKGFVEFEKYYFFEKEKNVYRLAMLRRNDPVWIDILSSFRIINNPYYAKVTGDSGLLGNDYFSQELKITDTIVVGYRPNESGSKHVTLYLQENGKEIILDPKVHVDCCGGGRPEFFKHNSDMVLLKTGSGDAGNYYLETYYINIQTKQIISTIETSSADIIIKRNGSDTKIRMNIPNTCATRPQNWNSGLIYEGARIIGLFVNENMKFVFQTPIDLKCEVKPSSNYHKIPSLTRIGMDKNIAKLYFKVVLRSQGEIKESYLFSLDLTSLEVTLLDLVPENLI